MLKTHTHAGTEFSMQHQNKQESFTEILLCASKSKILNENNCFLHKTHPQALAKLMLSVDSPVFPCSTGTFSSNQSDANHFEKTLEPNNTSKDSSWFNLCASQNDQFKSLVKIKNRNMHV